MKVDSCDCGLLKVNLYFAYWVLTVFRLCQVV